MRVRPVQPADRAEWLRLLVALYPHYPEAEHTLALDAFFAGTPHRELLPEAVFVSENDQGGLSGFLELSVRNYAEGCTGPTPYVESWYVDAELRGVGIGRALMAAAQSWAKDRGYWEMASDAELENRASREAHRSIGFVEVERAVHFRKTL